MANFIEIYAEGYIDVTININHIVKIFPNRKIIMSDGSKYILYIQSYEKLLDVIYNKEHEDE